MSSSRTHRWIVVLGFLALSACGFAPIYSSDSGLRGLVAVESNETVSGFVLQQRLKERLGRGSNPRYVLKTTERYSQRAAAISADGDTSRLNIIGTATWSLVDNATGAALESGAVEAFTSYSATGSTIATQATRDDAQARLSVILADLIVSRLLLLAPELPK